MFKKHIYGQILPMLVMVAVVSFFSALLSQISRLDVKESVVLVVMVLFTLFVTLLTSSDLKNNGAFRKGRFTLFLTTSFTVMYSPFYLPPSVTGLNIVNAVEWSMGLTLGVACLCFLIQVVETRT